MDVEQLLVGLVCFLVSVVLILNINVLLQYNTSIVLSMLLEFILIFLFFGGLVLMALGSAHKKQESVLTDQKVKKSSQSKSPQ